MAKATNEVAAPTLLTVKKARIYLEQAGIQVGDQQVRNLMRTNDLIIAGITEYTNPVTDEQVKVVTSDALDNYVAWRAANPEGVQRGGRKPSGFVKVSAQMTADQVAATNVWLNSQSFPELVTPVRKPRKAKNTGDTTTPDNGVHNNTAEDFSELELIEVG